MNMLKHTGAECGPMQRPILPARPQLQLGTHWRCRRTRFNTEIRAADDGKLIGVNSHIE